MEKRHGRGGLALWVHAQGEGDLWLRSLKHFDGLTVTGSCPWLLSGTVATAWEEPTAQAMLPTLCWRHSGLSLCHMRIYKYIHPHLYIYAYKYMYVIKIYAQTSLHGHQGEGELHLWTSKTPLCPKDQSSDPKGQCLQCPAAESGQSLLPWHSAGTRAVPTAPGPAQWEGTPQECPATPWQGAGRDCT